MKLPESCVFQLDESARSEIRSAVDSVQARGIPMHEINRDNFPLPVLGKLLQQAADAVATTPGYTLIRSLPLETMDREQAIRAFFGIGAWFGAPRPQNHLGHVMGHVKDLGEDKDDPATRIYRTNGRQRFHVDSCDIVGLLCLKPARHGGASSVVSSLDVFAEIERRRPDLADVLRCPFVYDRKGEIPPGKGPWYRIPIVSEKDGMRSIYFARDFIESAQKRFSDVPPLTDLQVEALNLVESLAESEAFRVDMDFTPGDMQFVNNHIVLHARTAYEDWSDPTQRRHLLRLWLSAHQARPLDPAFAERYGPLENGKPRGGIMTSDAPWCVPMEAE